MNKQARTDLYLVLGGNGFIGSHIVDKLYAQGKRVRVLDPFRSKPKFDHHEAIETIQGSAFDEATLTRALEGVTYVLYSLSATNPYTSDADPYADIENLRHGVRILDGCVQAGVRRIGFISSGGAVYGGLSEERMAEESDVPAPVSPYGICKLTMEHYMEYFHRKYGLDYIVYRLSNPYGPRQAFKREQGVIPAFLSRITNDEEITIFGDGSASRDYIYVEDAAQMITDTIDKQTNHHIYNIGSGHQTTLKEIITALESLLGKQVKLSFKDAPPTTLQKTGLNIQRYSVEFGMPDVTDFAEGLHRTIKHFISNQKTDISDALA